MFVLLLKILGETYTYRTLAYTRLWWQSEMCDENFFFSVGWGLLLCVCVLYVCSSS